MAGYSPKSIYKKGIEEIKIAKIYIKKTKTRNKKKGGL